MTNLIKIKESKNIYNIPHNDLFTLGYRANNEKRNFLFISKLLGKHLIINPEIVKVSGCILSSLLYPNHPYQIDKLVKFLHNPSDATIYDETKKYIETSEKTLVIGFAETATGLGETVASCIQNSVYGTTTRDTILYDENHNKVENTFSFEETHSHATTHKCYLKKSLFNVEHIILVDDEITTGNTMLNLIENLLPITNCRKFSILSILDWRNEIQLEKYRKFKNKYDINLEVFSLVSGTIQQINKETFYEKSQPEILDTDINVEVYDLSSYFSNKKCYIDEENTQNFLKYTGKFGCTFDKIKKIEDEALNFCEAIQTKFEGKKLLVVGHGENIYIPSRIASYLKADFKTTSRSPIYVSTSSFYPINDKVTFYDEDVLYNFYNVKAIEKNYDIVLFFTEKYIPVQLTKNTIQYII